MQHVPFALLDYRHPNPVVGTLATYTLIAPSQVLIGGQSVLMGTKSERCVFEVPLWECQRFVLIPAVLLVEDSQLFQIHQLSSVS